MKNTSVLGVPLSMVKRESFPEMIADAIRGRRRLAIVAINARKIVRAVREPEMRRLLMGFDVFLADGSSVVRAADYEVERIAGVDLMEDICRCSGRIGAKIFFYGASEESNEGARRELKKRYPDMLIAGYCNGYEDADVLEKINKSGADIVFIAKGTPLQERWIISNGGKTGASVLMGVGGSFDVFSGKVRRAPDFIQKAGLEWLYRMILEPKRFRQIPELAEFRRLVKREKKQQMLRIDGGRICKVKKLP